VEILVAGDTVLLWMLAEMMEMTGNCEEWLTGDTL